MKRVKERAIYRAFFCPFYNWFKSDSFITKPAAHLIPQGWWKMIEKLKANDVTMMRLKRDTIIVADGYRIESYKSSARQYQGHHPNTDVVVSAQTDSLHFRVGDLQNRIICSILFTV